MDSVLKQMTQRHTHSYPHGGVKNKAFATQKTRINTKKKQNKQNQRAWQRNFIYSISWFDHGYTVV